jgi:thioredoxin-related protein
MRRLRLTVFALFCACVAAAWAAETPLPAAHNLAQHAVAAQKQGSPLILLVSLTHCPYCEQVRKQHLAPMSKAGAHVRQIYVDSDARLIGFDGKPTTQKQFAKAQAVRIAPTVLFFNAQGAQLAEPLVGAMLEDFYAAYLDNAIATAKARLTADRKPLDSR